MEKYKPHLITFAIVIVGVIAAMWVIKWIPVAAPSTSADLQANSKA